VLALTSTETSEDGRLTRQLLSCGCSTTSACVAPFEPLESGRDMTDSTTSLTSRITRARWQVRSARDQMRLRLPQSNNRGFPRPSHAASAHHPPIQDTLLPQALTQDTTWVRILICNCTKNSYKDNGRDIRTSSHIKVLCLFPLSPRSHPTQPLYTLAP
jgi:hypothetical protein